MLSSHCKRAPRRSTSVMTARSMVTTFYLTPTTTVPCESLVSTEPDTLGDLYSLTSTTLPDPPGSRMGAGNFVAPAVSALVRKL